jgi:hypothetical protein
MSRYELLNVAQNRLRIAEPESAVAPRIVDEFGARNLCRKISPELDR